MRLIFSGSKINFPTISGIGPTSLLYWLKGSNHCDKSELHVFGPFLFYLRVSWCGGPIRMMNIQEVDEQELCRQIVYYVGSMRKDWFLRLQGYGWLWQ